MALPNRILSYSKIVKGESNSKWKNKVFTDFDIAEPHPIIYFDLRNSKRQRPHRVTVVHVCGRCFIYMHLQMAAQNCTVLRYLSTSMPSAGCRLSVKRRFALKRMVISSPSPSI